MQDCEKHIEDVISLFQAVRTGSIGQAHAVLRRLRTADVRDVFSGATPLHHAAAQGNCAMIKLLLSFGADVNSTSNNTSSSPLGDAAIGRHLNAVRDLLNSGAKLGECELDIIQEAFSCGDNEIGQLLKTASEGQAKQSER